MDPTRPAVDLPVEGQLPSFSGATGWLNSPPLTAAGLRGRVVLVDFWTYTCINWLRTLPYVRAWAEKYQDHGLVVIGVHTPEFDVERDLDNVRRAAKDLRVDYPVAIDNDYAIWDCLRQPLLAGALLRRRPRADPAPPLRRGRLRAVRGDLQRLLTEAGTAASATSWSRSMPVGWRPPPTGTACGRRRTTSAMGAPRTSPPPTARSWTPRTSMPPPHGWRLNQWALAGDWTVERQAIVLNQAEGRIAYRFHARDLHLVMGPPAPATSVRFRVRLDGQPPGAAHGIDVDDQGNGTVTEPRLYQLIRQPGPVSERTFEITFLDPGVQAYVFTFG